MNIDKIRVTCQSCKNVFDAEVVVNAPIAVAIASMQSVRCPLCGSAKCGLGGNYAGAPPVTAPIADRVAWWRDRGEHGVSSETIYSAFAGGRPRHVDVPHDPDDFSRCKLLLDLIPEWRSDLGKVVKVYPWFSPMIEKWAEIDAAYEMEKSRQWKGDHVCYRLMRTLDEKCQKLRRSGDQ